MQKPVTQQVWQWHQCRPLAVLLLCASTAGCGRSAVPPSAAPVSAAPTVDKVAAELASTVPIDASPDAPLAAEAQSLAAESSVDASARNELAEKVEPQRLILLTRDRLLVIHLELWIDGQPQRAAHQHRLDAAVDAARGTDDEATGDPAWSKLVADSKFTTGAFGNAPIVDAAARKRAIEQYDFNRDDHVQRDELAAFLAQNVARGLPFAVNWVSDGNTQETWNSPMYALLDQDGDGLISKTEAAAAATRLRSRDVNDDDALTMADLRPPQRPNRSRRYDRDARPTRAFEVDEVAFDSIYYALSDVYSSAGGLDETASARLSAVDTDQSGVVDDYEIAGLLTAPPDLLLKVEFASRAEGGVQPILTVLETSDELNSDGVRVVPRQDRLLIELPGSPVDIVALDQTGVAEPAVVAAELFATLDTDKNDSLDEAELAAASDSPEGRAFGAIGLELADADDDGELTLDELQTALDRREPYRDLQVQVRAAEAGDHLFGHLDARPDGRLTSRELTGAEARLAQLDRGRDGVIAPAEVPFRLSCVIVRGASDADPTMPTVIPIRAPGNAAEVPPWLAAMDRNGDGEVSRREFLGTAGQFGLMDANCDGFVDAVEALHESLTDDAAAETGHVPPDAD